MTVPPQINDSDGVDINHLIDLSDPGSWLDAIAHTPCLNVSDYAGGDGAERFRVLSLFSGIGALDLGLQRAGMEIIAQCENDPYASRVLERRFPGVPNLGDVRTARFPFADLIAAGFPCQDISNAGKRAGITGDRSGLWSEVARAIGLVQPSVVLLENVAALRHKRRGLDRVLGDLAALGYDAVWHCIPASHVGAPHNRDRIWITAASHALGGERWAEPYSRALGRMGRVQQSVPWDRDWESALREFRGMDDGSAYRVDRVDTLRNAVVPQIPELIGRAILAAINTPALPLAGVPAAVPQSAVRAAGDDINSSHFTGDSE